MPLDSPFAIPLTLELKLQNLLREVVQDLSIPLGTGREFSVAFEVPRIRVHGDLSASLALQLAALTKRPPQEVADKIVERLSPLLKEASLDRWIERIEVKPPGFINLFLSREFLCEVLKNVLKNGSHYGKSSLGCGQKAMVEFVSANPTGPLSVAHGRQAAVGDALANLLDFIGYRVTREYYLNDEGTQIDLLGESILARAKEALGITASFPENGYQGAYVVETAKEWVRLKGHQVVEGPRAPEAARAFGVRELTGVIRGELDRFGVRFDRWFPQSRLNRWGHLNRTLEKLKAAGHLYESEGAWWLKSTAFGDDKDRVVIRSDGRLTYIAADIAYHRRKFERGFKLLVNLWGPDHHGYISRLKAAVQALGFPPEALQIRIVQLCTLKRGNETIPMSTREGQFITLTQVIEEVGRDAARFFFLLRKSDAPLEFDLELAKKHSLENPVYYIQYAHARICSLLTYRRKKSTLRSYQVPSSPWFAYSKGTWYERLQAPEELELLRLMREFPQAVEMAAKALEPFGVVSHLQTLAEAFHRFYDRHRVVNEEDVELTSSRLDLVKAVQTVLQTGLKLLGISAPEKM